MDDFSVFAEKHFNMSLAKEQYFGGDGDTWIKRGKEMYFSGSDYILCEYHLHRKIKSCLPHDKSFRKRLYGLIDESKLKEAEDLLESHMFAQADLKRKEQAQELLVYLKSNRDGILNSLNLKIDEFQDRAGAIEGNMDKSIAQRFKGRGMSWSMDGASALLKIRQKIINKDWDDWWYQQRNEKIKITADFKKPLTSKQACMSTGAMSEYMIEASFPCYRGPDQGKYWVGIIKEATKRASFGVN